MTLTVPRGDADFLTAMTMVNLRARESGFRPKLDLIDLHAGQREVLDEAERWNVLDAGRRWGKSALYDYLAAEPVASGKTVFWFSLTYGNLVEVWEALKRKLGPYATRVREQLHRIETWTGGVFEMFTLWQPISTRGRRAHRAVIDEAAHDPDLETTFDYVVRPTLIDFEGDAWFLSTPNGFNFFHTLWQRGQDGPHKQAGWKSWKRPSFENPHLPAGELARLADEMRPEVYSQEILAEFVSDATRSFLPEWWLGDRNRYDAEGIVESPSRIARRGIFWDTAMKDKEENAYSAAVVIDVLPGGRLMVRDVWRGRPQYPALVEQVERHAHVWNYDGKLRHVVVEDKASGISLVQSLAAQSPVWLQPLVQPFAPPGDKTIRWDAAAGWCAKGGVLLPMLGPSTQHWLPVFEDELFAVPQSPFKDQADAFAMGVIFFQNLVEAWVHARRGETAAAA